MKKIISIIVASFAALTLSFGVADSNSSVSLPEHLAGADWHWDNPSSTRDYFLVRFTIHEMPMELPEPANGVYFMVAHSFIGDHGFYFGLQTNVLHSNGPFMGPGIIFSRWGTRDLANARWDSENGFAQSSGHEGDFIGVRLLYDWGPGEYLLIMNGDIGDGWWNVYGFNLSTYERFDVGSLRFPSGQLSNKVYSTIEIYGAGSIDADDIPKIHVEMRKPFVGYNEPNRVVNFQSNKVLNTESTFSRGRLHLKAGKGENK